MVADSDLAPAENLVVITPYLPDRETALRAALAERNHMPIALFVFGILFVGVGVAQLISARRAREQDRLDEARYDAVARWRYNDRVDH